MSYNILLQALPICAENSWWFNANCYCVFAQSPGDLFYFVLAFGGLLRICFRNMPARVGFLLRPLSSNAHWRPHGADPTHFLFFSSAKGQLHLRWFDELALYMSQDLNVCEGFFFFLIKRHILDFKFRFSNRDENWEDFCPFVLCFENKLLWKTVKSRSSLFRGNIIL